MTSINELQELLDQARYQLDNIMKLLIRLNRENHYIELKMLTYIIRHTIPRLKLTLANLSLMIQMHHMAIPLYIEKN